MGVVFININQRSSRSSSSAAGIAAAATCTGSGRETVLNAADVPTAAVAGAGINAAAAAECAAINGPFGPSTRCFFLRGRRLERVRAKACVLTIGRGCRCEYSCGSCDRCCIFNECGSRLLTQAKCTFSDELIHNLAVAHEVQNVMEQRRKHAVT